MKNFLSDLKIGTKIIFLVGPTLLSLLVVMGVGIRQINSIGRELVLVVDEDILLLKLLSGITFYAMEQNILTERVIQASKNMAQDTAAKEVFEIGVKDFRMHTYKLNQEMEKGKVLIERIYEKNKTREMQDLILRIDNELRNIDKNFTDFQYSTESVFNLLVQGKFNKAELTIRKIIEQEIGKIDLSFGKLLTAVEKFAVYSIARANKSKKTAIISIVLISVFVLISSLFLGIFISNNITSSIINLTDKTKEIAGGDLSKRVDVKSTDEIGVLGKSFNRMTQDLENAKERLVSAKEYTENIIKSMVDCLIVFNPDMTIKAVNKAACDILEYTEDELIGNEASLIISEEEKTFKNTKFQKLIEEGSIADYEMTFKTKNCSTVPMLFSGALMIDNKGTLLGIVGIAKDITERKKAEKEKNNLEIQLRQSERMQAIGQLAAGIAHEINNPIGFVSSNTSTLLNYINKIKQVIELYRSDTDKNEVMEKEKELKLDFILEDVDTLIVENIEGLSRVTEIVKNLRNFARIDQKEKIVDTDITEGLKSALLIVKNEIKYHADVHTEFGEIEPVKCNSGEINQVFVNILVNAAQAIKEQERKDRGNINIKTYEDADSICCEISDDGPGIPENIQSKIFDPFFTTKAVGKGTGLGLNISYDIIVNKHKGEIKLKSELGKGTTFIVKLPKNKEFVDV